MRVKMGSSNNSCFGTLIGVFIFGLVGMGLLIAGILSYNKARATQSWPTVTGTIRSAQIVEKRDEDGTTYGLSVNYDYVVADRPYSGSRIALSDYTSSSRRYALGLQEKYGVGTQVTVYYNPADPFDSVLEPGANWVQYLLLGMGCCFSTIPLLILFSFFRQRGF